MTGRTVVIHLIDGTSIKGNTAEVTDDDFQTFKDFMGDLMSEGSKGWQVNIELPDGGWAIFPKSSVLWVEMTTDD
jgi:hypothetical protein